MTTPPYEAELARARAFVTAFYRRQAGRTVDFPGGFAAFDERYPLSRGNNAVLVTGPTDPDALPGRVDELAGHLPYRVVYVLDDAVADACHRPLERAGYTRSGSYVMCHTGPVPPHGGAVEVDLDALRAPLTASWHRLAPQAAPAHVHDLVERRAARRLGAADVRFLASYTEDGEVASWADLYVDPETGTAAVEDLVTAEAHLGKGHAGRVLDTALHLAAEAGCGLRFLTAHTGDWPHRWYGRKGFAVAGTLHIFERVEPEPEFSPRTDT